MRLPHTYRIVGQSVLFGWLGALLSGAAVEKILPVPVYVESREVFTDLHLAMQVEELGFPLVGRTTGEDPDLDRMLGFFDALVAEQWAELTALTKPVRDVPAEMVQAVFVGYSDLIKDAIGELRIERVVELGTDRLLVWSMPLEANEAGYERLVRTFRFLRDESTGSLEFEGTRRDPLSILINSLYQEATLLDAPLVEASAADFEFGYDFPVENNGEPPRLLFNGSIVSTDVFKDDPVGSEPPALAFYREAMEALKSGDPAAYGPYFAPESREKFERWVAEMEAGSYDSFHEDMAFIGKRIYFVLDADPVHYLFHLPTYEGITGASFRYDMVWRNAAGEWEIVNFFIEGFFDDIVKDRSLFEEPFLRPTLIAADLIEDKREPLSIQAPTVVDDSPPPPPQTVQASPLSTPSAPSGDAGSRGMPPWVWALMVLLLLALAVFFWRQRASSNDANSSPS